MRLVVAGLSHRTAPIEIRERFVQYTQPLESSLPELCRYAPVAEACLVSTCNRVEFYVAGVGEPEALLDSLKRYFVQNLGVNLEHIEPHLYVHMGDNGLRHLFRVASSLDSMVLGEPQILGQVKQCFQAAERAQTIGPSLSRIFAKAFYVAKRVRTETSIAENAVSMSFAAVELGREIFQTLADKEVLLLGAGKMASLAAKHLQAHGVRQIRVANRSKETAEKLASELGGVPHGLAELSNLLSHVDIVISSTAAPHYVVDKRMMQAVVRERRYRPILFVDIAVPRDIDPTVADLDNVFVYDVDDLDTVLENNRRTRAQEADLAEAIVTEQVQDYMAMQRSLQVVPLIKALRSHVEGIAEKEATRTISQLGVTDERAAETVRRMSQSIVNKVLHPVLAGLKKRSTDGDPQIYVDTLAELFAIDAGALDAAVADTDSGEKSEEETSDVESFSDNVVPLKKEAKNES